MPTKLPAPSLLLCFLLLCLLPLPANAVKVLEVKSTRGITAWLVEDRSLPIISLRVAFREAGAAHDPPGREGLAHMAAALLSEGAGNYSALAFREQLESHAIRLGFAAGQDELSASLETLKEHRAVAGELLRLALQAPRFEAAAIARVRAAILSELRQLDEDPAYVASRALYKTVFAGHPYGRPLRGNSGSIQSLQRKDFTGFTRGRLTRGNLVVTVAGDITPAELAVWLDTMFAGLPDAAPIRDLPEAIFPAQSSSQTVRRDIPQTVFAFAFKGVKRDSPDYIPAYILNHILGGGDLTSHLSQEIREKRGFAYYAYTALQPLQRGAVLSGQFATRGEEALPALRVMQDTVTRLARQGVDAGELQDAKDYLVGSFPLELDSNRALSSFLLTMRLYGLGIDYLDRREALLRAVTREQVNRVARNLLTTSQLAVVIVGNPAPLTKVDSGGKP